jgi:hypothetical protein
MVLFLTKVAPVALISLDCSVLFVSSDWTAIAAATADAVAGVITDAAVGVTVGTEMSTDYNHPGIWISVGTSFMIFPKTPGSV